MSYEIITWVIGEDIKAVRGQDGVERLLVDGRIIPLTENDHQPTQQVINYGIGGKRARKGLRADWAALADAEYDIRSYEMGCWEIYCGDRRLGTVASHAEAQAYVADCRAYDAELRAELEG